MSDPTVDLDRLDAQQLRQLVRNRDDQIQALKGHNEQLASIKKHLATRNEQLTHEMALLKRWRYGKSTEQPDQSQRSLLDDEVDTDIAAIELELNELFGEPAQSPGKAQPKRQTLPKHLPRVDIAHEPDSTVCDCGCQLRCIGQDVAEKLDYTPGVFTVERHIRGKWA